MRSTQSKALIVPLSLVVLALFCSAATADGTPASGPADRRTPSATIPVRVRVDPRIELFAIILDRQACPRPGSYTAKLLSAGEDEILKKVGEEAMEVILAAKGQGDERLVSEIADLCYHLLVLLASRGLTPADVGAELVRRRR